MRTRGFPTESEDGEETRCNTDIAPPAHRPAAHAPALGRSGPRRLPALAAVTALALTAVPAQAALLTTGDIQNLIAANAFTLSLNVPSNIPGISLPLGTIGVTSTAISFRAATDTATGMAVAELAAPVTFTANLTVRPSPLLPPITTTLLDFTVNSLVLNPDPAVTWSLTANNFSAVTLPFFFTFAMPLAPAVAGATYASSQISGSVTDTTRNGVALNPIGSFVQNPIVTPGLVSTNAPSGGGFSRPATTGTGPITYTYTTASTGAVAGPTGSPAFTLLTTNIGFTLTGNGDRAALTGNATIDPVPLPAAAWLLLSGLAGIGFLARRQRAVP